MGSRRKMLHLISEALINTSTCETVSETIRWMYGGHCICVMPGRVAELVEGVTRRVWRVLKR